MRLYLLLAFSSFAIAWCGQPLVVTMHKASLSTASNELQNSPVIELSDDQFLQYRVISDNLWGQISRVTPPPYPPLARAHGFSGPVELVMEVNDAGELVKLNARKSKAYHPALIPTAQAWASYLRFPKQDSSGQNRKFRIYVVFSKGGRVEIQPTPETHFTQAASRQ